MSMEESKPNTAEQIAAHEAAECAWAEEKTWPVYRVIISGDDTEWVPRPDERYWMLSNPDDPRSDWIPKPAEELPEDATLHPETGSVVRQHRAEVLCHAKSEDMAKMLALRDNPACHTIESVELVDAD